MRERNKVSICVVICTFKRETYVTANLKTLEANKGVFSHVIVVDNARTLDASFASDFVEIIPNRNLGGSGGFTRGLLRAHELGYSHVLFMDDDISFKAETFASAKKTLEELPPEKKDSWIGFAMHPLDEPHIQFELGAKWNGLYIRHNGHNVDTTQSIQPRKEAYNYSAWWSLLMPTSVVDKYGLPLPFFIKFDDIEYGLRRKGEEILFNPDWYVLHESFAKKMTPYLEYYTSRNSAITSAIHIKGAWIKTLLRYGCKEEKFLLRGKIIQMHLTSKGIKDFLAGPSVLLDEDIVAQNEKVRSIASTPIKRFPKAFVYFGEAFITSWRLLFLHHRAKKAWTDAYPTLASVSYWQEVFKD